MIYEKVCEVCGEPFVSRGAKAKYCSGNCAANAFYRRKHGLDIAEGRKGALKEAEAECNRTDCAFYNLKRKNKCDCLVSVPTPDTFCNFFKTYKELSAQLKELKRRAKERQNG